MSRRNRERGSAAIEAVIGIPAFGLFLVLIILGGRVTIAHQAVESAAAAAARAASISRTQGQAQTAASAGATTSLRNQSVNCLT
ncbi:MAG: TadE family protein, partial [Actinomycetota bacterium]